MIHLIKQTLSDFLAVYKRFFSYFVHKIFVHILGIIVGLLTLVVFSIVFYILGILFSFPELNLFSLVFSGKPSSNLFSDMYLRFTIVGFGISFLYSHFLLSNVYLHYFENKKLNVFKNVYFDIRLIFKYLGISYILLIIALLFLLLWLLIFNVIVDSFGGASLLISMTKTGNFTIVSFLVLGITLLFLFGFLYFVYRYIFSYIYLIKESPSLVGAIKKSFQNTKGYKKLGKALFVFLLFISFYLPFSYIGTAISLEKGNIKNYIYLQSQLNRGNKEILEKNFYFYEKMKIKYSDMNTKDILLLKQNLDFIGLLYSIFMFVCVAGYTTLVVNSIFKNIIDVKN